jgi:hypothetical protein
VFGARDCGEIVSGKSITGVAVAVSAIGPKGDMSRCTAHVRFRCKADMAICGMSAFAVAIGGKADIACCGAYSACDPKQT